MKKIKKIFKYKSLFFLFLLVITGLFVGTIAYFRKNLELKNYIVNDNIRVKIIKNYNNTSWGYNKGISFYNNSSSQIPVLLRFRYSESWDKVIQSLCGQNISSWLFEMINNGANFNFEGNQSISPSNPLYSFVAGATYEYHDVLNNKVYNQDLVDKNWASDFSDNFVLQDGWYYYKKLLKPHEAVSVLNSYNFMRYSLSQEELLYYNFLYEYNLLFDYEAVQPKIENVQKAWGVNFILDGDDVTWIFNS